ncbi:hypothetical protein GUITHDRAFT_133693 [Guillardia theta CCMP2712]|uniref:Uncharacterized protein n=1 Tax=Guillardia theta (strain CCMP2712) TaxID=905079 RepID=L1JWE7_GUITC|nr:hypothetical protein GUITHDRAFT_133693 [Guillardia theta CCMP2712]EKX52659.1 hypothetical protein GUITHDRAFT_133693 [Guillardia theta CCMP2712]|eukprot:XP_005839639.1 hypothetical protein GUITHDRAFT_133693 [Guillardia theta CCMP2712]
MTSEERREEKGMKRKNAHRSEEQEDAEVDQDALERLERMQRERIMEMFGYDAEEENAILRAKSESKSTKVQPKQAQPLSSKKPKVQSSSSVRVSGPSEPVRNELPKFDGKGSRPSRPVKVSRESEATTSRPKASENFMSSKVSKVHGGEEKASSGVIKGRTLKRKTGDDEFISTARIVEELGASMFAGRKRRAWEAKRLKEMGAKGPKNQKVPYDILMRRKKKMAKLDERQEKMEVESGMKLKATKKKKKGKTIHSLNTVGVMTVKPLEQKKRGRGR